MTPLSKPCICITTYQREALLQNLLATLVKQTTKPYCVLVVDNASQSNVKTITESFKGGLNVVYHHEPSQGVVFARNRCVSEFLSTDSDALVWIDDDEWPEHEHWLENLLLVQAKTQADVVCSDVISQPEDSNKQFLAKALYAKPLAQDDAQPVRYFYTNNTLICRHVIEQVGLFDLQFNLTGSEDFDYCLRAKQAGFSCVYAQNAKVIELHPDNRSQLRWFALRGIRLGQGATRVNLKQYGGLKTWLLAPIFFGYRLLDSLKLLLKGVWYQDKGLLFAATLRFCSSIGTVMGLFGFKYQEYQKSKY